MMLLAAASLLVGCTAAPASHADYPGYGSIEEIASSADLVVRVTYVDSVEDVIYPDLIADVNPTNNPQGGLSDEELEAARRDGAVEVTVATVEIAEVFKGDGQRGDRIQISQLGTRDHSSAETTLLSTLPEDGSAVVFLRDWREAPYDLLNPQQGMFIVSADDAVRTLSSDSAFDIRSLDDLRAAISER